MTRVILLLFTSLASTAAMPQGNTRGFIFSNERVTHTSNVKVSVSLNESLPITQLKQRFSQFKVNSTAFEDCSICATITGANGASITINYDESGIIVTSIVSDARNSADALGNRLGDTLRSVFPSGTAMCDSGYWTTCKSDILGNLHYIVQDDDRCPLKVNDKVRTSIPTCARVGGFILGQ